MNRWIGIGTVLGVLGAISACDAVERVRGGTPGEASTSEGGVTLNLESPGLVRAGEEAAFRISVWNRADTAVHQVRAALFLPAWMEPLPPQPEGISVTMVSSGEGTNLTYAVTEPALQPGESRTVVQRIRTPAGGWAGADISPTRTVRAWLVGADNQPLGGEVSSDLAVEGVAADGSVDTGAGATAEAGGEGIGTLRLGMSVAEVRGAYPGARDTTWSVEGMTERGLVVPVAGASGDRSATAVARLEDDRVGLIRVADPAVRTAEGVGVGSSLEQLRAAYGRACADVGERGDAVVWFPRKPGISFVLDTAPQRPAEIRRDPAQLPGSASVRAMLVRRGTDGC